MTKSRNIAPVISKKTSDLQGKETYTDMKRTWRMVPARFFV